MVKVAIITGSTRPGRQSLVVAQWVHDCAQRHLEGRAEPSIVDIADFDLPLLDEPFPPAMGRYTKDHTKRWAAAIAPFDAFVFVTPEYNHSYPAALKNALDFLVAEWADKAGGFVSYGGALGARSVEHLRGVMGNLRIADVNTHVALSMYDDFEQFSVFKPREMHLKTLGTLLDDLVGWGSALKAYRAGKGV